MKIKDNVEQWRMTIEGVDRHGKSLVGGRIAITKECLSCLTDIDEMRYVEFDELWRTVLEKSEEELQ